MLEARLAQIREALQESAVVNQEQPIMYRISDQQQQRLDYLMEKNNEGLLSSREKRELAELAAYAQRLSIENAKTLLAQKRGKAIANFNGANTQCAPLKRVRHRSRRRVAYA